MMIVVGTLILVMLFYFGLRLSVDVPHIAAGTVPDDPYGSRRYVENPWRAYLHMAPGVIYLLGAPLQLSRRFRTRHYRVHRRLGRVVLGAGLVCGVFALAFGVPFSFGGVGQAVATAVFGSWFLACLLLAFRAIRRGDPARHRRWMVRAFTLGLGVGTIHLLILVLGGVLSLPAAFAVSFWLAFAIHVAAGEWWLRRSPALSA